MTKTLGDISEIVMGQSPDGSTYNTTSEGVPLINGPVEFSRGPFGLTIRSKFTTAATKLAKKGDLILCVRGSTTGRTNIAAFDACIGRGVAAIRANVYQPWINYFIRSYRDTIYALGTGSTFPNISSAALTQVKVPFPSEAEQRRIVGILDKAFADIATASANAEANVLNARIIFEKHLGATFTRANSRLASRLLGDVATFRNGINFTQHSKGERVRIIGVKDFQAHFDAPKDGLDSVVVDGKLSELDLLKPNDILTVRSNGNIDLIGRCMLVGDVDERASHSGFTIRIRLETQDVSPRYLCYFLRSNSTRKSLTESGTGTNIKSLNQGSLGRLLVPVPPIDEQLKAVSVLDQLTRDTRRLETIYRKKLDALEALKKSLLHEAFSGNL